MPTLWPLQSNTILQTPLHWQDARWVSVTHHMSGRGFSCEVINCDLKVVFIIDLQNRETWCVRERDWCQGRWLVIITSRITLHLMCVCEKKRTLVTDTGQMWKGSLGDTISSFIPGLKECVCRSAWSWNTHTYRCQLWKLSRALCKTMPHCSNFPKTHTYLEDLQWKGTFQGFGCGFI